MKTRIRRHGWAPLKRRKAEKGSILIGLIVTIGVFAALGAAVVPLFSTSYMSKVSVAHAAKAYYMAESGFRYAASRYLHAASSIARDDVLEDELHDATFTLSNNGGGFSLEIEGYFYKYNNQVGTNLTADAFGQLPTDLPATGSGRLMIPDYGDPANPQYVPPVTYTSFTKIADGAITFTLSAPPSFSNPQRVFSAAVADSVPSTGSLTLQSSTGQDLFPAKSGSFRVFDNGGSPKFNGDLFLYGELSGDTLTGITNATDPTTVITSADISSGDDIVALQRSVKLTSTGTFGTGIYASSREIFYSVNLEAEGLISTPPEHEVGLDDLVDDNPLSHGQSLGDFDVVNLGGNDALDVTGTTGGSGNQPRTEAMIALNGGGSPNPFYLSWDYAGKFLNYDAQVKIGIGEWDSVGFINKPEYYMAGLSTRIRGTTPGTLTSYGISFIRTSIDENDGIPDSLVPDSLVDTPLILLWDRGGRNVAGDIWLAYMELDVDNSHVLDVVGDIQYLKDWSTIMVRMVEAASIKYLGSSNIAPGDTVTEVTSGAEGYVIKKIGDGSDEVLLLNNVDGTFSTGETVSNGTVSVTVSEWRAKDNYIWAFYGDTDNHSTNDVAIDLIRGENERGGDLHWLPAQIDDWSPSYDHFTLVEWNPSLNTGNDPSLRRMGTGKEGNGIIRTNWYITPSVTYDYEPELGLHALGSDADETYFDDFAYYIQTASGSSSSGFINAVVLD